jgi:hypothetical protein
MYPVSQAENLVQTAYRNALRDADTRRKREAARMLDYFNDVQVPYIQEQLARERAAPERYNPVFLNIVKKIIRALSVVYLADAVRVILNGTEQDTAIFAEIEETAQLPAKMKTANRYSRLLGTIMIRPVWRDGKMDLDIYAPDVLDVVNGDTPEDVTAVLVTFDRSGRNEEIEYDLWTEAEYQRLDYRGNVLSTEPNPYGVIPFIPIFSNVPTDSFWLPGAHDLMAAQDEVNRRLTALSFTADLQGFGIAVAKGVTDRDGKAPDLKFSPGDYLGLPEGAAFAFESPNAPITDMIAMIDFVLKQAAICNGLTAATMSTNPTQESGIAKLVGNSELEEQRRDQIALFAGYEQQLFELFRRVWNHHNPQRQMSQAATLRVQFHDPKPALSAIEQARTWETLLDRQLISPVDIMIERNPDLTREDAKARLREIRAEINEFMDKEQFADYTPPFGSKLFNDNNPPDPA